MKIHHIPINKTGYFSKMMCDYSDYKQSLTSFYTNKPSKEGLALQLKEKSSFPMHHREVLVEALRGQYEKISTSDATAANISSLSNDNTFTITTGHQLNLFTGPLYFLYKIVSVINLTKELKSEHPEKNFVPIYWMATEDHDFEEINFFRLKGEKISFEKEVSGAVGRIGTEEMEGVFEKFKELSGISRNAKYLQNLFEEAYLKHDNLTEASRYLVNELFGSYGLVIVDGDDRKLKELFAPAVMKELTTKVSYEEVSRTNERLEASYKIQVNPREINLFYLKADLRERIIFKDGIYKVNNTEISFSESEILKELQNFPERFSPNVILRPLYQEIILPNLCYIGGGGELAYWMQLKAMFKAFEVPFPVLMLRNSVLLADKKQLQKLEKLGCSLEAVFAKQETLITNRVKEQSDIPIDFSDQKLFLQQQFDALKEMATKTDASFIGAVNAQEKKQLNGLDNLEKRLLKAQKRKYADEISRLRIAQDALFPNQSLEERTKNFSEYYIALGDQLIPMLFEAQDPLNTDFTVIEY